MSSLSDKLRSSQFYKKLLDNKFALFLIISLLIFLNLLVLTQILFIFQPVVIALEIIGPPLIVSGIIFYLINPTVDWLENKGISRKQSIILMFILLGIAFVVAIYFIIPAVQNQIESLIASFPQYWEQFLDLIDNFVNTDTFTELGVQIQEGELITNITRQGTDLFYATIGGIGSVIGTIAQVIITIFTAPIILYYFLTDGKKLPKNILQYTPTDWRKGVAKFLNNTHNQLGYYVRGQLIVAFCVGVMFWIGFSIIRLDYALVLGITAGLLNLVPYLGSFMAAIPALIIGIVNSPWMMLNVIVVLAIEQFLEGRVVQPLVLGTQLNIHPITIIFILLISGRLFGLLGIILAIPGYAVIKIIVAMAFEHIHDHWELYHDDEEVPAETSSAILEDKPEDPETMNKEDLENINKKK